MDGFVRWFFGRSDVCGTIGSCVRSDKRGAHNLLKLHCVVGSSKVKDTTDVGVFCSRYETRSLVWPDLTIEFISLIPYINGLESSSLYTCNTSWRSVHYMILSKPLVRLTTADYQCTVSMISFAQVLTAQWSDTIPNRNVQFQVRIDLTLFCFNTPTKPNVYDNPILDLNFSTLTTGKDLVNRSAGFSSPATWKGSTTFSSYCSRM